MARDVRFDRAELRLPGGAQVALTLDNQDSGIFHDIAIFDASGAVVAQTEVVAGPAETAVTFLAPAPGSYPFMCNVHPRAMRGTAVVQ